VRNPAQLYRRQELKLQYRKDENNMFTAQFSPYFTAHKCQGAGLLCCSPARRGEGGIGASDFKTSPHYRQLLGHSCQG